MNALLADAILLIHFAFVLFVVGGLVLIWIGAASGWHWIRNRWFRIAHLAAIALVAAESVAGVLCPLTVWEDALRGASNDKNFMARWVHHIMFFQLPEWVFTVAYVIFTVIVALTILLIPPRPRQRK